MRTSPHTLPILSLSTALALIPLWTAHRLSGPEPSAIGGTPQVVVDIDPGSDTFFVQNVSVTIEWCGYESLDPSSRLIKLNGDTVTSDFDFNWVSPTYDCNMRATSEGTVTLDEGVNNLYAQICDDYVGPQRVLLRAPPGGGGGCDGEMGSKTVWYTYDAKPPPVVSTDPHNGDILSPGLCEGCFDLIYAHSTPAYFTLDAPQAVTLFYSSYQAAPRGLLSLDAWNPPENPYPPDSMSVKLKRPDQTWVTFTTGTEEVFYAYADGDTTVRDTVRLSAQFDATGLSTGAYGYTAVVTSWWNSPAESDETTLPVRLLVLNEKDSGYLAGWTIAGIQTIVPQGDTLLVLLDGAGGIVAFDETSTDVFEAPRGEFSKIHKTGTNSYQRLWQDSTKAYFSVNGGSTIKVDSIVDRFGNVVEYDYRSNGTVQRITDPMGWRTDFYYTSTWDGLEKVYYQDTPGATLVLELTGHATTRDLLTIEDRDNLTQTFTYDTLHRMKSSTDREGATTDYEYDDHSRLKQIELAQVTLWNGQNRRPTVKLEAPERIALPPPDSSRWDRIKSSDVHGRVIGPLDDTTRTWFNGLGRSVKSIDAVGRTAEVLYNGDGLPTQVEQPSGQKTLLSWNGDKLVLETLVGMSQRFNTYESTYGFVKEVKVEGKLVTTNYYSGDGKLDSVRVGNDTLVTAYQSDSRGRITEVVDPEGHRTRHVYHSSTGNVEKVILDDGEGTAERTTKTVFDSWGRVEKQITPTADTTRFVYDQINRVTKVYDPVNASPTETRYGPIHPDSVIDPKGEAYRFTHNALGWVTERYGPASATLKDAYGYDEAGQAVRWTNRNGQAVKYYFDVLGRATKVEAPDDTLEFGYDPQGEDRFSWAKNAWSTDTTWYTPWGGVDSTKTKRAWDSSAYRVDYEYDHWAGRPTKLHDRYNDRTLRFAYNDLAQVDTLVVRDQKTWVDTRNANYLTTTWRYYPGQISQTLNYTGDHTRAEIKWLKSSGDTLVSRNYGIDKTGRITDMDVETDTMYQYEYDRLGRLLKRDKYHQESPPWWCSYLPEWPYISCDTTLTLVSVDTFTYDAIGNRTDHGAQTDPGSRLQQIAVHGDTVVFSYDSAGNVTRREESISGEVQQLYWGALGQLDSVVMTGGSSPGTVRFRYDALGRRIWKEAGADSVEFAWAMGHVLFNIENDTVTEYSYLVGTDRLHSMYRNGEFHFYLTDKLGSVVAVVDSQANVKNSYRYDSWGWAESSSEQVDNDFGFTGRELDDQTGFYYLRARYYDSCTGRFLAEDPTGLASGINPYAYAADNPIVYRDPTGMRIECTGGLCGSSFDRPGYGQCSWCDWELYEEIESQCGGDRECMDRIFMEGEKVYRTYSSAWDETGTDRPSNLGWEIRKAERKEFGVVYSIEWAGPLGWMGVRISMEMWEQGRFSIIMDMPWGGAHVAPKEVYLADETFYLTNRRIRSTFAHEIAHVRYYESIPNEYGKNKKRNNHRADCLASAMMGERFLPWYGCK